MNRRAISQGLTTCERTTSKNKMAGSSGNEYRVLVNGTKKTRIRRKVKNWGQLMLGTITGLLVGLISESHVFMNGVVQLNNSCSGSSNIKDDPASFQKLLSLKYNEDPYKILEPNNSYQRPQGSGGSLVFVGVMTAQKYLSSRAVAVYETWGRELPGRIAFFSSETSVTPSNRMDLPLVRLRHVDDSYPPQKKSFMMLQYIWENYGDRFEWFIRADDDVYMRPDKLENFLRSMDSRKAFFIGQAGRGNQEEFGLLSLEYDENFCMGGPGIIMSRETLRRIAPHIRYCLKNLYTTHEDVELGRCVRKFADVSCTWSYEMQTILYHNSSGFEAFTGNLKQKEVNRAITLHPIKQHRHMYRIHSYMRIFQESTGAVTSSGRSTMMEQLIFRSVSFYSVFYSTKPSPSRNLVMLAKFGDEKFRILGFCMYDAESRHRKLAGTCRILFVIFSYKQLKIQETLHEIILLQRDLRKTLELTKEVDLIVKNVRQMDKIFSEYPEYATVLKETNRIGLEPNLNKFRTSSEKEILYWDFIQRSLYSADNLNPRRRMERAYREGVEDVIREFMETINKFSRQRGRVIEYQDLLYGYARFDPLHGADYILDLLLKYKKYRGRKMTVPVRRHAYLQRQFANMEIREKIIEDITGKSPPRNFFGDAMGNSFFRIKSRLASASFMNFYGNSATPGNRIINFILPLAGRYNTFLRFIRNYEEVCLKEDTWTSLFVILFKNEKEDSSNQTIEVIKDLQQSYPDSLLKVIQVEEEFARAAALEIGASHCPDDEFNILFFIDVDMVFDKTTLERIRLNTIRGKQVYFPIVFSEFDPTVVYNSEETTESPNHFIINSNSGYWRQFGFGIASMYNRDLRLVGGFNTTIKGWGKEDVDVFDKFVNFASNITIFRSVDPTLVHVFHLVECSSKLEESQLKMCKGTRKDTYGSINQLAHLVYNSPDAFKQAVEKKKAKT